MIEPTERALWAVAAAAAVGALGFGVPAFGDAGGFLLAFVAALCALDFALAGSPRAFAIARALPELSVEGQSSRLALTLTAPRGATLDVVHSLPADALSVGEDPDLRFLLRVARSERAELAGDITFARRGRFSLGRVTVRTRGPLGLMVRRARHALGGDVSVVPDVARIGAHAERLLRGADPEAGARRRSRTEGRELDSLREYVRGDDPRLIEWKVTARRGALVSKKMRPEMRQDIVIALDTGRHLSGAHDARDGGQPRLDVAVTTALTLAAAALSRGDRAGLLSFAAEPNAWVPPQDGRGHLRRLALAVFDARPSPEEAGYAEVARHLVLKQRRRALVCFISDVLDEPGARALAGAVAALRGRHVPLVIALSDPALSRLARDAAAPVLQREAAEILLKHRARALAALSSAGAIVLDAPAPRAAALAVQSYADVKAQGRL